MLPADAPEHARLDMQHEALRLYRDGMYASPALVKAVLSETQRSPRPMILDIGTGTGKW